MSLQWQHMKGDHYQYGRMESIDPDGGHLISGDTFVIPNVVMQEALEWVEFGLKSGVYPEDDWHEISHEGRRYDLNMYTVFDFEPEDHEFAAALYPVVPDPHAVGMVHTRTDTYVKLNINSLVKEIIGARHSK